MSKFKKLLLVGSFGLLAYFFVRGRNIADMIKKLSILPVLDGAPSISFSEITLPIGIVIKNPSEGHITIEIKSAECWFNGSLIAYIVVPEQAKVNIKANAYSYLNKFNLVLPIQILTQTINESAYDIANNNISAILNKLTVKVKAKIANLYTLELEHNFVSDEVVSGLGLVANSNRIIKPISDYIAYLPNKSELTYEDAIVVPNGDVDDTVELMKKIVNNTLSDTARLAQKLKGTTLKDTISNVWNFVYQHIDYVRDNATIEQVRRPLRTLYDQAGDCDCYATLIGSILANLNIPFKFRIAAYNGKKDYQHVYVIVPYNDSYYVCDPVLDECFTEKQPTKFKDYSYTL